MKDSEAAFLGTGWSFPPTFSRINYSVKLVSGVEDINQSLVVLFNTMPGSRIMLPTYGCDLMSQVFSTMTSGFKTALADYILTAITNWEPRITVDDLQVSENASTTGQVDILIDYTIRLTNTRSSLVYPFYLTEGTLAVAPGQR